MSTFEEQFNKLARIGCRITVFPIVEKKTIKAFQVNIGTVAGQGWICATNVDPMAALLDAAEQRIRVDGPGNLMPLGGD